MGLECWLDIHQMGGGDSLYDKIDKGIRGCSVVVNCVTEKYSKSMNCRREVSLADALKKPMIPLMLESMAWPPAGPMSMPLSQLEYIDFTSSADLTTGKPFDTLISELVKLGIYESDGVLSEKPVKTAKPAQSAKPAKASQPQKPAQSEKTKSQSCGIL